MKLEPIHFRAIGNLSFGMSVHDCARDCDSSTQAIYRWINDPDFKAALDEEIAKRQSVATYQIQTIATESFEGQLDFKTWGEQGPPKGSIANYPPRDDAIVSISGAPAPARIGTQMFANGTMTKMVNHVVRGMTIDQATSWAANELEGFMRT